MNYREKLYRLDIPTLLDRFKIRYTESGKNISGKGIWLGIDRCPNCGIGRNHAAVSKIGGNLTCWNCTDGGTVVDIIAYQQNIPLGQAQSLIHNYHDDPSVQKSDHQFIRPTKRITKGLTGDRLMVQAGFKREPLPQMAGRYQRYIESRGYDFERSKSLYDLWFGGPAGPFARRIAIPYFDHGRIIAFQAMACRRGPDTIPYLNSDPDVSAGNVKELLYGEQWCRRDRPIIVTEGCLDVWRIGPGAVSLGGKQFTKSQILSLIKYHMIYILFDAEPDALLRARDLACQLDPHKKAMILKLPQGDPDDLNADQIKNLRLQVFQKLTY